MSKTFVGGIIAALMAAIAGYVGMVNQLAANENLRTLFVGIDSFLSCGALLCLGSEFVQMRLIRDADEGSFFASEGWHLGFRILTLGLFVLWAVAQWGDLLWIVTDKRWSAMAPYTGAWHQWSAMLKRLRRFRSNLGTTCTSKRTLERQTGHSPPASHVTKCWTGVADTVLENGELIGRDPVNIVVTCRTEPGWRLSRFGDPHATARKD